MRDGDQSQPGPGAARSPQDDLARAAHDLKNALGLITLNLAVLLKRPAEADRSADRKQLLAMDQAVERMAALVDRLVETAGNTARPVPATGSSVESPVPRKT